MFSICCVYVYYKLTFLDSRFPYEALPAVFHFPSLLFIFVLINDLYAYLLLLLLLIFSFHHTAEYSKGIAPLRMEQHSFRSVLGGFEYLNELNFPSHSTLVTSRIVVKENSFNYAEGEMKFGYKFGVIQSVMRIPDVLLLFMLKYISLEMKVLVSSTLKTSSYRKCKHRAEGKLLDWKSGCVSL